MTTATMQLCGKQYVPPDPYQTVSPSASFRIHRNAETLDTEADEWADFTAILNYCVKDARDLLRAIKSPKNAEGQTLSNQKVIEELTVLVEDLQKIDAAATRIINDYSTNGLPKVQPQIRSLHWPLGFLTLTGAKDLLSGTLLPQLKTAREAALIAG